VAGSVAVSAPDISSALASFDFFDGSLDGILDGIDLLLGFLQDAFQAEVFGSSLPFVGDRLATVADFIAGFRSQILDGIRALPSRSANLVRQALFDALGPSGGLDILGDRNGDLTVDLDDVGLTVGADEVRFEIELGDTISAAVDLDPGLPGLVVDGQAMVALSWALALRFGISRTDGFFLDTSAVDELQVSVTVTTPGLDTTGNLGFLSLNVKDDPSDPSSLSGSIAVDLLDPVGTGGRFTFAEMSSPAVTFGDALHVGLDLVSDINFHFAVSFPGEVGAAFP
jgi:hypothetical protein